MFFHLHAADSNAALHRIPRTLSMVGFPFIDLTESSSSPFPFCICTWILACPA